MQCRERMGVDGEVVTPVDIEALRKDLQDLKRQKPEAVTISLLNSYANDKHENQVAEVVRDELGADVEIVCSAHVLPEAGEYERTVTAAANAVVRPVVKQYLGGLQKLLQRDSHTLRILKSDGGLTSPALAEELPVNLLMSGPAGGVQGVVDVIAQQTRYRNLITLDMGGTSTDCALIVDGTPALRRETVVDRLTVRSPSIDVRTVGAGGGSIATFVELTQTLRVGPESAGAVPGPACYRQGGRQPTVTDANLLLGYLPAQLLGGDVALDVQAAAEAVTSLANQMGQGEDEDSRMTPAQAAEGIVRLVNETMYGALRLVSVEQGYDARDFALVAFGGAGPLHANAVGKLLGAWPVLVPPSPGVLCAQGDMTTKLRQEQSASYLRTLAEVDHAELTATVAGLERACRDKMLGALDGAGVLRMSYECDARYRGQALSLTLAFSADELAAGKEAFAACLTQRFHDAHQQAFHYALPSYELALVRLGVVGVDASANGNVCLVPTEDAPPVAPPASAVLGRKMIIVDGQEVEATFWDRSQLATAGVRLEGPCVVSEMDANTLILPGYVGEIDHIGNIVINPIDTVEMNKEEDPDRNGDDQDAAAAEERTPEAAAEYVRQNPLVPTLMASALASIRNEMDTLMLRCAMSPAIREQQDEFNVITNTQGQMLVGQFGSFIAQFLAMWTDRGTIEEGDVFVTNDVYEVGGAVTHLNDVIVLLPIFYRHALVGWAANFGHLTDVGGRVPGSMSIEAQTVFEDGVQVPVVKLFSQGVPNDALIDVLCRNSRQPAWFRSDLTALVAACRRAATRVRELHTRYGAAVYTAACDELLRRNRAAVARLIATQFDDTPSVMTDFVDDDGHGVGPYAVRCTMRRVAGRLCFDWTGTSAQSAWALNYMLSPAMFRMFVGYYLLAIYDPQCVVNDGFHDLVDVHVPPGCVLRPVRPAAVSCRTHLLGRVMDIVQALMGQRNPAYRAAAGFSDSPHFFYSGWTPAGAWFQLYQIGFGGVPARPRGDGPDCHCLFPAIKSVPTESIERNFPLRIEANEALADTGGAGFYRGGNAQRTLYRFLARGEVSLHDDRWFTKPWGIDGGQPGSRSRKILYKHSSSSSSSSPERIVLPSKCDHVQVMPGDLLEWITWGGGGMGDPLTRPADKVAREVHRKLVTVEGARRLYGVVVDPHTYEVCAQATQTLRAARAAAQAGKEPPLYNRGGSLAELRDSCLDETGLPPPEPQWAEDPYGPHVAVPYVVDWYRTMREKGGWDLE